MRGWRSRYTALALALLAPGRRAPPAGGVLVVGDSLEELTSPYLAKSCREYRSRSTRSAAPTATRSSNCSKKATTPRNRVIVFDAGTNDNPSYPQILAENLGKVAATVGDRCMVVPTIHGLHPGGVGDGGKNRTVAEFAASRPGTQSPDWAGRGRHPPGADAGRRPAPDRSRRRSCGRA